MNEEKIKILLAEDDVNLGSLLRQYLLANDFEVELCADGEKAYKTFMKQEFDICILDVMMPQKDGFALANDIRSINSEIPIIFLTAKSMKEDVLEGFKIGGDDYITKPFNMQELLMRIEAVLRRAQKNTQENKLEIYQLGKYTFDTHKQILYKGPGDKGSKLTTKESELLQMLCENMNQILERNTALKKIWSDDNYFNARSMDVYITKLRKHLQGEPSIEIMNVHGKGYKLVTL